MECYVRQAADDQLVVRAVIGRGRSGGLVDYVIGKFGGYQLEDNKVIVELRLDPQTTMAELIEKVESHHQALAELVRRAQDEFASIRQAVRYELEPINRQLQELRARIDRIEEARADVDVKA